MAQLGWLLLVLAESDTPHLAKGQLETLANVFKDGFTDFDLLVRASTFPRKIAAVFEKLFVRHPSMWWLTDAFFLCIYHPLVGLRDGLRGGSKQ